MDNKELKEIGGLLGLVALLESFGVRDKDGNTFKEFLKKNSDKPKDTTGRVEVEIGPGDVEVEIGNGGHGRPISVKAGEEASIGDKFILESLISDAENKRNGDFAFPFQFNAGAHGKFVSRGMTLREYYAGQALKQALEEQLTIDSAASVAVAAADALIAELKKAEHDDKAGKAEKTSAKAK